MQQHQHYQPIRYMGMVVYTTGFIRFIQSGTGTKGGQPVALPAYWENEIYFPICDVQTLCRYPYSQTIFSFKFTGEQNRKTYSNRFSIGTIKYQRL